MTCAKAVVSCEIISQTGERFIGRNDCANPQPSCPREEGEGYEKCQTICQQMGHAEEQALEVAGDQAQGSIAMLYGHTYFCSHCQHKLFAAGVSLIGIGR